MNAPTPTSPLPSRDGPLQVDFTDVVAAAGRIARHAHRTPVLRSAALEQRLGAQLFFKCENFQRMGAFKFRGAFNALSRLSSTQRHAGVVAYSSGNHAQAVALSAQILGLSATIVMPHDASPAKLAATQGYGATVVGGVLIIPYALKALAEPISADHTEADVRE